MPLSNLRVVVVARLHPAKSGGVAQAVLAMVAALGRLTDGDERYFVIADSACPDWLDAVIGPNTRVVFRPEAWWRRQVKRHLLPAAPWAVAGAVALRSRLHPAPAPTWTVAGLDSFVESLQADVVHFPYQIYHRTTAPSIFNPMDLQHLLYPTFFNAEELEFRARVWPQWCREASAICTPSAATKGDVVAHYQVAPEKVYVVPLTAQTELLQAQTKARGANVVAAQYQLPSTFMYYPAQTFEHKNHLRLFEAVAKLRDERGITLSLVCSGYQNAFWPVLQERIHALRLAPQVRFLGFVPAADVQMLYRMAEFTVFPTLFEGAGLPLQEAFREHSPLACSHLPVLVEQGGGAPLYFDPLSVDSIAFALFTMHTDPAVRNRARERGDGVARRYSAEHSARTYRALYRALAGATLTAADSSLLEAARAPRAFRPIQGAGTEVT